VALVYGVKILLWLVLALSLVGLDVAAQQNSMEFCFLIAQAHQVMVSMGYIAQAGGNLQVKRAILPAMDLRQMLMTVLSLVGVWSR
jgi:hypothetical protein